MIPHSKIYGQTGKSIVLGQVFGGQESDPLFTGVIRVDNIDFSGALKRALINSRIFNYNDNSPDLILKVNILSQEVPMAGIDMKVTISVMYFLIDSKTKEEVWSKQITTDYTSYLSEAFNGQKRLVLALEGAVRENIIVFLNEVSKLTFLSFNKISLSTKMG